MRTGRWESVLYRELRDPLAVNSEGGVTDDEQTPGTLLDKCLEGSVHIITSRSLDPYRENRCAQRWSCRLGDLQLWRRARVSRIPQDGDTRRRRSDLFQQ